jgi:monothiol glutaredoxin
MGLSESEKQRIESMIGSGDVVLFMKGNRMSPQCGFSARVVQMLDGLVDDYKTYDVLQDPDLRDGIKEYSNWPTIPQLYIKGEFIGGCDIVSELYATGELHDKFGVEKPQGKVPTIAVTPNAAARIKEYMERNPGGDVHLSMDARHQASLSLSPARDYEIMAESNGVRVYMDAATSQRADGLTIDVVETPTGARFKIDSLGAPAQVKQITPQELKQMLEGATKPALFDVRTPEERAIAHIEGARLLDQEVAKEIEKLPKDSLLVFHCHHGGRSQAAAEHFRDHGFTNVHNLAGGIDAWSVEVDPSVPRY